LHLQLTAHSCRGCRRHGGGSSPRTPRGSQTQWGSSRCCRLAAAARARPHHPRSRQAARRGRHTGESSQASPRQAAKLCPSDQQGRWWRHTGDSSQASPRQAAKLCPTYQQGRWWQHTGGFGSRRHTDICRVLPVNGLSMVCQWSVNGLSMVCQGPLGGPSTRAARPQLPPPPLLLLPLQRRLCLECAALIKGRRTLQQHTGPTSLWQHTGLTSLAHIPTSAHGAHLSGPHPYVSTRGSPPWPTSLWQHTGFTSLAYLQLEGLYLSPHAPVRFGWPISHPSLTGPLKRFTPCEQPHVNRASVAW